MSRDSVSSPVKWTEVVPKSPWAAAGINDFQPVSSSVTAPGLRQARGSWCGPLPPKRDACFRLVPWALSVTQS